MTSNAPPRLPDAAEFQSVLERHVIDVWFPRCIDREHGGFLSSFDRAWHPYGTQDKLIEFQARQTLLAADALRLYPEDARLREAVDHGFRQLEVMWDRQDGGWFHLMDRAGKLLEAETKHAHGAAYAIEACASVYASTANPAALRLAQDGFAWLERYARDPEHGGYFGMLTRGNRQVLTREANPLGGEVDSVGTRVGLKDANVNSDLVETFTRLYEVWPDAGVQAALAEVADLVAGRMVTPAGAMHLFVTADWTPIPHVGRAGYQFQTACRLLDAGGCLGREERYAGLAARMVDHALRYYRDDYHGGFFYGGVAVEPMDLGGQGLVVREKSWWVQAEAVRALLAAARLRPDVPRYAESLQDQWRYVRRRCLDEKHGGMYAHGIDEVGRWRRKLGVLPAGVTSKGSVWKDASHDGRAWIYCRGALAA